MHPSELSMSFSRAALSTKRCFWCSLIDFLLKIGANNVIPVENYPTKERVVFSEFNRCTSTTEKKKQYVWKWIHIDTNPAKRRKKPKRTRSIEARGARAARDSRATQSRGQTGCNAKKATSHAHNAAEKPKKANCRKLQYRQIYSTMLTKKTTALS